MATEEQPFEPPQFVVRGGQPLIGVLTASDGEDYVTYFTDEDSADVATMDDVVEAALSLAGAWSDVHWDDIEAGLDQIRHASEPSPPIEL